LGERDLVVVHEVEKVILERERDLVVGHEVDKVILGRERFGCGS